MKNVRSLLDLDLDLSLLHALRNNHTCTGLKSLSRMSNAFNYDLTNSHSA